MPRRPSKAESDPNLIAFRTVEAATNPPEPVQTLAAGPDGKNPYAVALGRLGGKKGGLARAENLSAKERKAIARKAAKARWSKEKT
ncbi:MAG: hypothetical protein ACRD2L_10940 [Terriglobia bacterium]